MNCCKCKYYKRVEIRTAPARQEKHLPNGKVIPVSKGKLLGKPHKCTLKDEFRARKAESCDDFTLKE